jgi:hypothetical protein
MVKPISCAPTNSFCDTHEYKIEFTDGTHKKYQVNIIAKNMYTQVDSEGNQYLLLQEIQITEVTAAQFQYWKEWFVAQMGC